MAMQDFRRIMWLWSEAELKALTLSLLVCVSTFSDFSGLVGGRLLNILYTFLS